MQHILAGTMRPRNFSGIWSIFTFGLSKRDLTSEFRAEDRTDLATEHKKILGDEVKVLGLIKTTHSSGLANDDELRTAYRNVGLKAFSEKRWQDSLLYLSEAGEMDKNIRAHFMANNYQDMSIIGMFRIWESFNQNFSRQPA